VPEAQKSVLLETFFYPNYYLFLIFFFLPVLIFYPLLRSTLNYIHNYQLIPVLQLPLVLELLKLWKIGFLMLFACLRLWNTDERQRRRQAKSKEG
jgi:hypothetical protein